MNILKLAMGFQKEKVDKISPTFFQRLFECFKNVEYELTNISNPDGILKNHAYRHELAVNPIIIPGSGEDLIHLDKLGSTSDNTRLNATTVAHGLLPKLSGTATEYLDGSGVFDTPVHSELSGLTATGSHPAAAISYDNSTSGLTATEVQAAIDEVASNPDALWSPYIPPTSPSAQDDEFAGTSLDAKWTETTDASSHDHGVTIPSCITIDFGGNQSYTIRQTYAAAATFTLTAGAYIIPLQNYHGLFIFVYDDDDSECVRAATYYNGGSFIISLSTRDANTWTYDRTSVSIPSSFQPTVILNIARASDVWSVNASIDNGRSWIRVTTYAKTFTVDHFDVKISQDGQTALCRCALEFLRRDWITL